MDPGTLGYLAARGLSAETVARFRIGRVSSAIDGHEWLTGRLTIPYLGPRGNVYNLRFRCLQHENCKAEGCHAKYISLPNMPSRVFNTRALVEADAELHVTEGELDAVTLAECGLSAVGLPGVENMPSHFPRMVAGFERVYLWADGDEAGRALVKTFTRAVPAAEALILREGEDVNSLYTKEGKDGILRLVQR